MYRVTVAHGQATETIEVSTYGGKDQAGVIARGLVAGRWWDRHKQPKNVRVVHVEVVR